jgi:hypothetical protein
VRAPKCATLRYLLQPLSSTSATMATMTTRAQQFDSGKEVTEDNGMGTKILEATNDPASSAMHIEPPGAENVMKSTDSHHSLWSHALWQQRSRHSELPRPSMGAWHAHLRFSQRI